MKVLIVDDEAHIRLMMRMTLEAAGYEVDEAATGEEGVARCRGGGYAAVLLDQKMPGIDGLQTLVKLKELNAAVPVIMVTAFASIELAVDALKLGATDFLRKPMTPEALRGAVAAALAGAARPSAPAAPVSSSRVLPDIETLTFNGFRITRSRATLDPAARSHVFAVRKYPGAVEVPVTVEIDPEAEASVARLSRRSHQPGGSFWREHAESVLASYLWTEGSTPANGRLTVTIREISREDIERAAVWEPDDSRDRAPQRSG
jgi:DNA-binding response OmpR family regulator